MKIIALVFVFVVVAETNPQFGYPYPNYFRPPPNQPQIVEGSYTFIDPSGIKRTVKYTSDGSNNFNAVLQQEPASVPPKKDKQEQKEGNETTTDPPEAQNDKKPGKSEDKIQYVPVPVYPPNVASRSFGSSYVPYSPYPYRGPYGFTGPYG